MKYSRYKARIGDGITPRGCEISNEIEKNRHAAPKNFVPLKKRFAASPGPSSRNPLPWGGAHKRKPVKITLAKRA